MLSGKAKHPDSRTTRVLRILFSGRGNIEPLFVHHWRSQDCIEKLVKALETIARELHQRKQTHRYFTGEAPIDPDEIIDCWIC